MAWCDYDEGGQMIAHSGKTKAHVDFTPKKCVIFPSSEAWAYFFIGVINGLV